MPKIPGARLRQSPYAAKLARLEPEGATALAQIALVLLDAINASKLVATDAGTRALLESLYPVQNALYGASDGLPEAMSGFFSTAKKGANHG
ncbi:hypothetical protein [Accumulibacter sp.]|uniref:hypothetical protein n=1 Tax=Accumulibacter sp. TaxID=2053492 RepID=UPI002588613B|nr:hypothetical protein [Accumulibacter sp.]